MKALSLLQPWCSVVVAGLKPIENRKTRPPASLVGQEFAIHSSLGWDQDAVPMVERITGRPWPADQQPRGMILAVARLVGWVKGDPVTNAHPPLFVDAVGVSAVQADQVLANPWYFGPVGYLLDDVRALPRPIRWKGAIGWWNVPPDVEQSIREQLG